MKKFLLGASVTLALGFMAATQIALAGSFGGTGSGHDSQGAKTEARAEGRKAGEQAFADGHSVAHSAHVGRDVAAKAEAARAASARDDKNGEVGTWINDN